tara:strand:+ start:55 stop:522 length:468 start_codon:yes stop_codon:yes gene_type:complete
MSESEIESVPRKAFTQSQWRRHRQITVPILIIVFALAMFGAIYLAETSRAAVTGRHVQQLRREIESLGYENDLLHANNAYLQSASQLMERAKEFGYVPLQLEQIEYMVIPGFGHDLVEDNVSDDLTVNIDHTNYYDENLADWILGHLQELDWGNK